MVAATPDDYPVRGSTLTIREVSHRFDLEWQPLPVLDRISLQIGRGEFVALLGRVGAENRRCYGSSRGSTLRPAAPC